MRRFLGAGCRMAGDILYFLHRNFRGLVVLSAVLALLAMGWLLSGATTPKVVS